MADGIDPFTGKILDTHHICNSPDVIRALYMAVDALSDANSVEDANSAKESSVLQEDSSHIYRKNDKLNAGRKWTDDDLRALERMYKEGLSLDSICRKLQRRKRGVLRHLEYLGLIEPSDSLKKTSTPGYERSGQKWTVQEDATLKILHSENCPIAQIAEKMHRSAYAVYCRMDKLRLFGAEYGYPPDDELPPMSSYDVYLLRDMFLSGKTIEYISDYLKRPEASIRARLFYMGLSKDSPITLLPKKP